MKRKIVRYYWRWLSRLFKETSRYFGWNARTIPKTFIPFAVGLALIYFVLGQQAMIDRLLLTVLGGLGGIVAMFVIILLLNAVRVPVQMYDELGGFDDLLLEVEIECRPASGPDAWVTFNLHSRSKNDITECIAHINKVVKESDSSWKIDRPLPLLWSSGNPPRKKRKTIKPGTKKKEVDVASSIPDSDLFGFQAQSGRPHSTGLGTYSAQIEITGTYNKRHFRTEFDLCFTYEGGTNFICENNLQRQSLEIQYD